VFITDFIQFPPSYVDYSPLPEWLTSIKHLAMYREALEYLLSIFSGRCSLRTIFSLFKNLKALICASNFAHDLDTNIQKVQEIGRELQKEESNSTSGYRAPRLQILQIAQSKRQLTRLGGHVKITNIRF